MLVMPEPKREPRLRTPRHARARRRSFASRRCPGYPRPSSARQVQAWMSWTKPGH